MIETEDRDEREWELHRRSEGCGCHSCRQAYENYVWQRHEDKVYDNQTKYGAIMYMASMFWMMQFPDQHAFQTLPDGDLIPVPEDMYDPNDPSMLWLDAYDSDDREPTI